MHEIGDARADGLLQIVTILADGRPGEVLARVVPAARLGTDANPDGGEPPLFVLATPVEVTEEMLAAAIVAGAAGLLIEGGEGWADLERVCVRLDVAEASARAGGRGMALAAMTSSAASLLALCSRPPAIDRLVGIGLDAAALAPSEPAGAGAMLTTARGITLLAAAAAGVPAFERPAGAPTIPSLAASRAAGFAWALVPVAAASA